MGLMPHFTFDNLRDCFWELDSNKALGVDKVSVAEYAKNLEVNLYGLVGQLKNMSYKPQPSREVLIPKQGGKTRPLGISTTNDKIVQMMFAKVLNSVYEPLFLDMSYGFRPGRN